MPDNPYDQISRLPSSIPTVPDTSYENSTSPQRPQPRTSLEEFSSHFPMEFPPKEIRSEEDFPGRSSASR